MKDYRYFTKVMSDLKNISPEKLDEQLLLYGGDKVKREIPFMSLLAQFKYCLCTKDYVNPVAYAELKTLLSHICGAENIDAVEEQYNVRDKR